MGNVLNATGAATGGAAFVANLFAYSGIRALGYANAVTAGAAFGVSAVQCASDVRG